jgi:5-formyltetrahydrofolate cyclo-ligase
VDVARSKQALRRELLARRREVPPAEREAAGRAVAEGLVQLAAAREAPRVALYAATSDELPTRPLFDALAATGCLRLLPRIRGEGLEFARVDAWNELAPGRFGVLAPPQESPAQALGSGDVVVLPGVAFSAEGHRLGRGGGHYDRTLAGASALLVGAAFAFQLVERVPHDSRDRSVDAIVTEHGVLWARKA